MKFELSLARFIVIALFAAVMGGVWDAWWHSAIGRESFLIPPHLMIYIATLIAVGAGVYGWRKSKEKLWRNLAIALLLVPASGPFDEMWHRAFGIEKVASPLIVWSPPHLMLIGAIIAAFILVLPILQKDQDPVGKVIFEALSFGAILTLVNFLTVPLDPTGPYHLLGFWGVGFHTLVFLLVLLFAKKYMKSMGSASLVAVFFIFLSAIGLFTGTPPPEVEIPPHEHSPTWLNIFSTILPALGIDVLWKRLPSPLLGGLAGLLSTGILFYVARLFFEPAFQYGLQQGFIATVSGLVAGVIAGMVVRKGVPTSVGTA